MDGLPGRLPDDEHVLWQSGPVVGALLPAMPSASGWWQCISGCWWDGVCLGSTMAGHDLRYALVSAASCVVLGTLGIGLFCLFAWLIARSTTYTITEKRVVLTYGMALPKSLNLPFSALEAADMRINADGTGDIALRLPAAKRLSYLLLWPHVRSGAQGRPEPVLRCIPAPQRASEILAEAIAAALPGVAVLEASVDRDLPDAVRTPSKTAGSKLAQAA